MGRVDITIPEGDRPLLRFYSKEWIQSSGQWVKVAIDLTAASALTFIKKATKDTPDNDPGNATITGVVVNPAVNGEWTAQLTGPVTSSPGTFVYKAIVTRGGNPVTVQHGALIITNT